MSYKVTEFEVFGYRTLIMNNTEKSTFFSCTHFSQHPIWEYRFPELIAMYENDHNTEKFFEFDDCFENVKLLLTNLLGRFPKFLEDFYLYNTRTIQKIDVEDCLKEVKI